MLNIQKFKTFIKDVNTFDDLYIVTENMTPKEKGDIFEYITFYLYKLSPRYNI